MIDELEDNLCAPPQGYAIVPNFRRVKVNLEIYVICPRAQGNPELGPPKLRRRDEAETGILGRT